MAPRRRSASAAMHKTWMPGVCLLAFVVACSLWLKERAIHHKHTQPHHALRHHHHPHPHPRDPSHLRSPIHSLAQRHDADPTTKPYTAASPPPPSPPAAQPFYMQYDDSQCHTGLHVIFSTICADFGDWQAEGLVFSHHATMMKGSITRIVSCSNPNYTYPQMWHPCYSIHVLPDLAEKVSVKPSHTLGADVESTPCLYPMHTGHAPRIQRL
jgi:hypothetical protein